MRFYLVFLTVLVTLGPVASPAQTSKASARPLMWTGIAGRIRATGLADPQYVLSFVPVQRLMLAAVQEPLTAQQIDTALANLPVMRADLIRLGLIRSDGQLFRLNYLLLTAGDALAIDQAGARYGASLANAFLARKPSFDRILENYQNATMRQELLFDLVAGVSMNWQGLRLTSELGFRAQPKPQPDGSSYFVHSQELGSGVSAMALYEDSETAEGATVSFTTFGDGESSPRLRGWPDVFDGIDAAVRPWKIAPQLYEPLKQAYIQYTNLAFDDAGLITLFIADGATTDRALEARLPISAERRRASLLLLEACGYVTEKDGLLSVSAPLLETRDKPIADAVIALSRDIMTQWLRSNHSAIEASLQGLTPMRNGIPFTLVFSETWHAIFGHAAKVLAEDGYYWNPRGAASQYPGYVPLVWVNGIVPEP